MALALRRAKLMDTGVIALLLILLSVVHYALLHSNRSYQMRRDALRAAYSALLIASWPLMALGAAPMFYFWFKDRAADRAHLTTAGSRQLLTIMAAASLVSLGCLLMAVADVIWAVDFGFGRFHPAVILALISFALLLWIGWQEASMVREANAVRKSLADPPAPDAEQGAREASFDPFDERPSDDKNMPF